MTTTQISKRQATEMKKAEIKFETARKIRELLDAARKEYGAEDFDENDLQTEILELVTEE